MFSRLLGVPLMLAAAVGVPYIATHGPNIDGLFPAGGVAQTADTSATAPQTHEEVATLPRLGPESAIYSSTTPLEGIPSLSLQDVFNLNVTREWVYQRWARKSTALSEFGLFGVRVPLVTGTQMHDMAGSLTYYFDHAGRVNRISFHGSSADTSQLVALVTQQFGLQQQPTLVAGEQLFQIQREQHVFSELRTRPAPVLWSNAPHKSFAVDLELQHPQSTTPLPSRLAPLPVVKNPPKPQPAEGSAEKMTAKKEGKGEEARKKGSDEKAWKAFFPRSRVPSKQVDGLDRRSRMW